MYRVTVLHFDRNWNEVHGVAICCGHPEQGSKKVV
jgi:hypothetical protein